MTNSDLFLGLNAFAALVHAAFLIAAGVAGYRLFAKMGRLEERLERDLEPLRVDLARVIRNAAEVSETVRMDAARVGTQVEETAMDVRRVAGRIGHVLETVVAPLVTLGAFFSGVRRAVSVYRAVAGGPGPQLAARGIGLVGRWAGRAK